MNLNDKHAVAKYVKHHRRRAVSAFKEGENTKWVTCLSARRIVGTYQPGETILLAEELSLSKSQVENLAHAGEMYAKLRPLAPDLPAVRRALTIKHFYRMWELMRKYEFSPHDAIEDLRTAAAHGTSVGSMEAAIEGNYGEGNEDEWRARGEKIYTQMKKLQDDYGCPSILRSKAMDFVRVWENEFEGRED